jgi:hypothetical protein
MAVDTDFLSRAYRGDLAKLSTLQSRLGLDDGQIVQILGIKERTWRRWKKEQRGNLASLKLLAILAGHMPWKGWEDWEIENGYLFPPGYTKNGILPGEFFAIVYYKGLARDYRQKIKKLQAEVQRLEERLGDRVKADMEKRKTTRRTRRRRRL